MGRLMSRIGFAVPDAFRPLARLRQEIEQAFADFDVPAFGAVAATYPALNTWEDDASAYVEAELPGVAMEQIEVSVTGNELSIRGQRKTSIPESAQALRSECPAGAFARTVTLPWVIDAEKVEAKLQDGVLTVKLPKAESAKPRKVKVTTA